MAQNVTVAGASYSDVPSVVLPKTGGGSASFHDVTDTTAAAADVASGKLFHAADGTLTAGTNQGGGGVDAGQVYQDANGYLVLDDDSGGKYDPSDATATAADILYPKTAYISGGKVTGSIVTKSSSDLTASNLTVTAPSGYYASNATKTLSDEYLLAENIKKNITIFGVTGSFEGGGGGFEYETGTWTPASDANSYVIQFSNTHTTPPAYYEIVDATGTYSSTSNSFYRIIYVQWDRLFGSSAHVDFDNSGTVRYGRYDTLQRTTSATSMGTQGGYINYPATETGNSTTNYPRFWATETGIKAAGYSTTVYWRTGRTYKWIAVWSPTS